MPKQTTSSLVDPTENSGSMLLDTHVAVWLAQGSSRLKSETIDLIEQSFYHGNLCLSPISAWEIGMLVSRKKLDLHQDPLLWFNGFVDTFRIRLLEITPEVAINSSFLPGSVHGDPADRIILATAMLNSARLISADKVMLSYGKQGYVSVVSC